MSDRVGTDVQPEIDVDFEAAEPAPVGPPVIDARGLEKGFDDHVVLRDLTLYVQQGEIYGLIGPSGSGKSTAIHLMCGHLSPDNGAVEVLGQNPAHFSAKTKRRIGYMPQGLILNADLTVQQNVRFAAGLYGVWPWLRRRRVRRVLELTELWPVRKRATRSLSGGMQRRLALAAALVHEPYLLFADEPTANLDPILRAKLWEHFRGMSDQSRALLITTQYIDEAENCDRVGLMHEGALIAEGRPEELRRQAFGGDVVDIVVERQALDHARTVSSVEGVVGAEMPHDESVRVTVENAQVAIPMLIEELEESGATVRSVSQYQPTFDEVFIRLIEQHGGEHLSSDQLQLNQSEGR